MPDRGNRARLPLQKIRKRQSARATADAEDHERKDEDVPREIARKAQQATESEG